MTVRTPQDLLQLRKIIDNMSRGVALLEQGEYVDQFGDVQILSSAQRLDIQSRLDNALNLLKQVVSGL